MGFIYDKNKKSDKKSITKIGQIVTYTSVQTLKEAGFTPDKTAEILGIDIKIVRRHWTQSPKI